MIFVVQLEKSVIWWYAYFTTELNLPRNEICDTKFLGFTYVSGSEIEQKKQYLSPIVLYPIIRWAKQPIVKKKTSLLKYDCIFGDYNFTQ